MGSNGSKRELSFTEEQLDDMVAMYEQGYLVQDIANKYDCLSGSVWARVKARGAKMRPFGWKKDRLCETSHGYWLYGMEYVHRIVAEAWYGPIPEGYHVHHKDGDKKNNHPANLEVLPAGEHARMHGDESGPWGGERDEFLVLASEVGIPARSIAEVLDTTIHAVSNRRRLLKARGELGELKIGRRPSDVDWNGMAEALWERIAHTEGHTIGWETWQDKYQRDLDLDALNNWTRYQEEME